MVKIADLSQANPNEIQALQQKELEILKFFKTVCDSWGLTFYLAGGTCIGALRHHGFIPWDDDVDVFMPRVDYERLYSHQAEYINNEQYELCRSDRNHNYHHAAMTLNDSETTFINFRTEDQDVNQGIAIDILPIDNLADGKVTRIWQQINAIVFSIFINQRLPDNQGKFLRLLTHIPLSIIKNPKTRFKIWSKSELRISKSSGTSTRQLVEFTSGLKGIFRPLAPEWFNTTVKVKFEDTEMPVPVGYAPYLKLVFGDYMKLPPKEARLAKHHTVYIDTENSYKIYRGKYYLKDTK